MDAKQEKVIEAIRALDLHATASEVSVKTGLPLRESTWFLNKIASDTRGVLEVAGDGTIRYKFAPTFQSVYLLSGAAAFFAAFGKVVFDAFYYLLRISFGVMLVLSLLTIIVLIIVVIVAAITALKVGASGDSGGDVDIDVGGGFNFFDWIDFRFIGDLFYWDFYSTSYIEPASSVPTVMQKESKGNFLLNCFSFLFGDGNPNRGIEDFRWETIANVIKHHRGVVMAEDIAPYLYAKDDIENAMLDVMVRFNGQPEVSENGNIVYLFPELASLDARTPREIPYYLEERQWDFSSVPPSSMLIVISLSIVNFIGSYWLFKHLASFHGVLKPFTPLVDILLIYSTFFLFFPIIRYIALIGFNVFITARNAVREKIRNKRSNPDEALARKIQDAHEIRLGLAQPRVAPQVVYTTDKDLLEQQFEELK